MTTDKLPAATTKSILSLRDALVRENQQWLPAEAVAA